jgi:predicted nucleic acid-binding protein
MAHRAAAQRPAAAATALAHDLSIWTQDDDFAVLADLVPGLRVARA